MLQALTVSDFLWWAKMDSVTDSLLNWVLFCVTKSNLTVRWWHCQLYSLPDKPLVSLWEYLFGSCRLIFGELVLLVSFFNQLYLKILRQCCLHPGCFLDICSGTFFQCYEPTVHLADRKNTRCFCTCLLVAALTRVRCVTWRVFVFLCFCICTCLLVAAFTHVRCVTCKKPTFPEKTLHYSG